MANVVKEPNIHNPVRPVTGTAQVVSLIVRPSQVSHLCFEVGGILGELNTQLGASLTSYSFANLYTTLTSNSASTDPSLLHYGPSQIQAFIGENVLASLRAESAKVALSKAINARQNAYFAKYGSQSEIIARMQKDYSPSVNDSKPYRLTQLQQLAESQVGALKAAYDNDSVRKLTASLKGVVTTTTSKLTSDSQSNQKDKTMIGITSWGDTASVNPVNPPSDGKSWPDIESGGVDDSSENADIEEGTSQTIQHISNTDYGFRIPYYECEAQYQRAQISLIDQQFAQYMYSLNFPNLAQVFQNELSNIDSDVYRLQVAYANTMLMTPIAGMVTGIYKNPGDAVSAGEPIIRVENNNSIFLVGTLIYSGLIMANLSTVQVNTTLFGSEPGEPYLTGTVVAARGLGQENQWAVVLQCDNPSQLYPLGYNFDYDDTTVTITTV